jgi:catechol 2,3-dioxygenase
LALRYGTRNELADVYRRIRQARYPVTGASDHGVSEAIYLTDPEGNGLELYADRPRPEWRWHNGQIDMVTTPLSLDNLLSAKAKPETPPEPELGHIHLHVADLATSERFYSEYIGLAVTQRSYPGALFFAAGTYHHHIGVNVWAGKGCPPSNSTGLVSYRLEVPVTEVLYCLGHRAPLLGYETRTRSLEAGEPVLQIRDPNGNWLEIQPSHGTSTQPESFRAGSGTATPAS